MHIFLKRAKLNEALLGDGRFHLRQIAEAVSTSGTDSWADSTVTLR